MTPAKILGLFVMLTISGTMSDDSQSIDMVLIPAGEFQMGSTGATHGETNEYPVHRVTVSSFELSKHEVTQAQFEKVMGYTHSKNRGAAKPVERVSWYDAIMFCNRLSEQEGLSQAYRMHPKEGFQWDVKATGFRLPTEAEWEYASKAGTTADTYGGDVSSRTNLDAIAWYSVDQQSGMTRDVGLRLPNRFGLFDMHGNVWEWCWDYYDPAYFSRSPVQNPQGPESGRLRVLKGGAMDTDAEHTRVSYRYPLVPEYVSHNIGFRVARSKK